MNFDFKKVFITSFFSLLKENCCLKKEIIRLSDLSYKDSLTGAYNRRYLYDTIKKKIAGFNKDRSSWALIMIDLDDFKSVNDRYGHPCGDYLLKQVVDLIKLNLRCSDFIIRYGGDEFCILTTNLSAEDNVEVLAEKIRLCISKNKFNCNHSKISIKTSIGTCFVSGSAKTTLEEVIKAADIALYDAKKAGKNTVVSADSKT